MSVLDILKKSYKDIYDNIAQVIMTSLFWFFTAGLLILFSIIGLQSQFILPILIGVILVGPITGGCFYQINQVLNYKTVTLIDLLSGVKKFFLKSMLISWLMYSLIYVAVFYIRVFNASDYRVLNFLTGIWYYLIFIVLIVAFYLFPLMIEYETVGEDTSLKNLLRASVILILKELKYSLLIFVNVILFSLLTFILMMPLPVLFMGAIGLFANNSIINLLIKYDIRDDINGPYSLQV